MILYLTTVYNRSIPFQCPIISFSNKKDYTFSPYITLLALAMSFILAAPPRIQIPDMQWQSSFLMLRLTQWSHACLLPFVSVSVLPSVGHPLHVLCKCNAVSQLSVIPRCSLLYAWSIQMAMFSIHPLFIYLLTYLCITPLVSRWR